MAIKSALLSLLLLNILLALNECASSQSPKKGSAEIFKISRDTIHVDIEGMLTCGLLINNKYYTFYAVRDPNSTLPIKKCYIISTNGKIVKEIKVPEELHQDVYSYLRFWDGHIIANSDEYENKSTYFLDEEKDEFIKQAAYIKVPVYEDNSYQVTGECRGEFGSTTYFKSKTTGRTYSVSSGCPVVINKLDDKYLIDQTDLVKITDTAKKGNGLRDVIPVQSESFFSTGGFFSHFYIATSFLANGNLYHIYNTNNSELKLLANKEQLAVTKDTVKIGTIIGGKFNTVYTLQDHIHIALQQQLSPDCQVCTFHTEERITVGFKKDIPPYKEAKYGFIEIKGNEIKIHYFLSKKAG